MGEHTITDRATHAAMNEAYGRYVALLEEALEALTEAVQAGQASTDPQLRGMAADLARELDAGEGLAMGHRDLHAHEGGHDWTIHLDEVPDAR